MHRCSAVLAVAGVLAIIVSADLSAQPIRLSGQVMDATTRRPVADALVELPGLSVRELSAFDGRFSLPPLSEGRHIIRVTHVGYGTHEDTLHLAREDTFVLVRISARAIALEALSVQAAARERTATSRAYVVNRAQIEATFGRARHLGDVVRSYIPGASMYETAAGYLCLEFRGARGARTRGCNFPLVVVDNVPIPAPWQFLRDTPPEDIDRLEFVPASAGAARYGVDSQYGVLVIETRRSGVGAARRAPPQRTLYPSYQWELEPGGHPWPRTLAGSALGNAIGIGAGLAVLGCFGSAGAGESGSCFDDHGIGVDLFATALPAMGVAAGARLFGATERSHGRIMHTAIAAAVPLLIGYATYHDGETSDFSASRMIGGALIIAGAPIVATLADALFRRERAP